MSTPFKLTKSHILATFAPLSETTNLTHRNTFFTTTISPTVKWTITGSAHSLASTTYTMKDHAATSFNKLGKRLKAPIKFTVKRVIVDEERSEDGWWACVELQGEATRTDGERYDNEYVWLTRWDEEGRIVEVRSYFDTMLAEEVLRLPTSSE